MRLNKRNEWTFVTLFYEWQWTFSKKMNMKLYLRQ